MTSILNYSTDEKILQNIINVYMSVGFHRNITQHSYFKL